jgi:outer membrane protein assembly factor BamB
MLTASCSQLSNYLPEKIVSKKSFFQTVWSKNLDPQFDSGNLPIALQSPEVDDGIVYVGDNKGYMVAYELENGREIWRAFDGSTYHSTPVVYKNKLIYGTVDGRVIARNTKNGDEVFYNVDLGSPVETAGTVSNGKILFHLRNHQIFCLDLETGKIIWGFKKSISYLTTLQKASSPLVYNNKVFVGFADGTLGAIGLDEGILLYEVKLSEATKFLDIDSSPILFDGKIYIGSQGSPVTIIEPNTGKILRKSDFLSFRKPIIFNDQLVFGTSTGDLVLTDKNLTVLKSINLSKSSLTSLVTFKNKFVVGSLKGEVFSVDSKDFELNGKFEFGHAYSAIFSDIVSKEDHLIILSSRNRLFAFY